MGHLDLQQLLSIGDAAVRGVNFVSSLMTEDRFVEIERVLEDLARDDPGGQILTDEPGDLFTRVFHSAIWGSMDLALSPEWDPTRRRTYWYLTVNSRPQPDIEVRINAWVDDMPLLVRLQVRSSAGYADGVTRLSMVERLRRYTDPAERAEMRALYQRIDAYTRGVVVAIDPQWNRDHLRNTVQAQLVEWFVRIHGCSEARQCPELDDGVLGWWLDWAARLARRNSDDDKPDAAEMYEVARRTLRPSHPAAHRKYWHKWLAPRSERLVRDAAGQTGVSVRTIYSRMREAGLHTRDFAEREHPLSELVVFLRGGSSVRSIPDQRRTIRDALIESGMNSEAARKFERRIRELPSEEQARRVGAALARNKRTAGPANARYST